MSDISLITTIKNFFKKKTPQINNSAITITSRDIKAIAGDDVLATQLDLARAYLEIGKKSLAKKILLHVTKNGDDLQRNTASELLKRI